MKSQEPPRRWGQILIPLIILTSICVPGMEAMNCGGTTCGHGTSCGYGGCYCKRGYTRLNHRNNLKFCSETCQTGKGMCPVNTTCKRVSSWGKSKACLCSAGAHRSAKGQCLDINECANKRERCGNNSVCENTVGSYKCVCAEGYRQGEQVGCNLDIDECTENPTICGNNSVCVNTVGNYTCACAEGYKQREGEAVGCNLDIDECTENQTICGNNSVCVNTEGNYTCACVEGYKPKESEELGCNLDIDECTENQTICGNNSVCTNTVGNYTCVCAEGYRQRDSEEVGCNLDIDECTENQTICGNNSVCVNTEGNYTCTCAEGYRQKEGEELGCNLDIDECTENPNTCGNNSVCVNTEGNYMCACAVGYKLKEGEEFGCRIATAAAASTAADSSTLTIGLAAGIGGVVLLAVVVLAVVFIFRARNRSSGGIRECIGLEMQGKRSDVITHEYITNQSGQQRSGVTNPIYPVLPDVLGSNTQSGTDVRYEEVDLPPQAELNHDAQSLYSLAGNFDDKKPSYSKHKDLYSNHKIADNKAKQVATEKSQASETYPTEPTYHVLSKPHVKPSTVTANIPDNYSTLYDMNLKPTNESPNDPQTGYGNPHKNDDVQYDTTYTAFRQNEDNRVPLTSNEQLNGSEYDELTVQTV